MRPERLSPCLIPVATSARNHVSKMVSPGSRNPAPAIPPYPGNPAGVSASIKARMIDVSSLDKYLEIA